ncbi:hypothetical protein [Nostoc sp. CMAA1605]|uniref:hypothetical protein n=1 Tax=Nostoc sp. CMAA1605 TaxID=2055159 RepID=UPI001F41484D|nr:hypothetical protein [Nostoc sp. CMAA1605]MCF4969659.1 hypothetical protein [Nostoc sp. CMAA1605]
MISCPCCSDLLLPHIRGSEVHWFCRHCWQDMPVFQKENTGSFVELIVSKLSSTFETKEPVTTDNQSLVISH